MLVDGCGTHCVCSCASAPRAYPVLLLQSLLPVAEALGKTDTKVSAFVAEALTFLSSPESSTVPAVLGMALKVGEVNLRVLELLSTGHSDRLGVPTPTEVTLLPTPGKAILVTGHDMNDLELL